MASSSYVVRVNDVPAIYKRGHFPRKFAHKAKAIMAAKEAIALGASMARVECPGGGELDFRPDKPKPADVKPAHICECGRRYMLFKPLTCRSCGRPIPKAEGDVEFDPAKYREFTEANRGKTPEQIVEETEETLRALAAGEAKVVAVPPSQRDDSNDIPVREAMAEASALVADAKRDDTLNEVLDYAAALNVILNGVTRLEVGTSEEQQATRNRVADTLRDAQRGLTYLASLRRNLTYLTDLRRKGS